MSHQRRFAMASLFAAAAGAALAAPPPPAPQRLRTIGTYAITRHKFGITADWSVPHAKQVEQMPLDRTFYQDNTDFTLLANGMVQCNTAGLYRAVLCMDWKAQAGLDIDRRMIGVRRKLAGDTSGPNLQDIRLGSIDTPAADVPRVGRWNGAWDVVVPAFESVTAEVPVAAAGNGPAGMVPGDLVQVAHSGISTDDCVVSGRVVGPDLVRVTITNNGPTAVTLAGGVLNVLVQSATLSHGESNDAWQVLNCPLEELVAGDRLYVCVRTIIPGDYVQATDRTTVLHLERFG